VQESEFDNAPSIGRGTADPMDTVRVIAVPPGIVKSAVMNLGRYLGKTGLLGCRYALETATELEVVTVPPDSYERERHASPH